MLNDESSEDIIDFLDRNNIINQRVLIPGLEPGFKTLTVGLGKLGNQVATYPVYGHR